MRVGSSWLKTSSNIVVLAAVVLALAASLVGQVTAVPWRIKNKRIDNTR